MRMSVPAFEIGWRDVSWDAGCLAHGPMPGAIKNRVNTSWTVSVVLLQLHKAQKQKAEKGCAFACASYHRSAKYPCMQQMPYIVIRIYKSVDLSL
jgi:hypothetical protein